MESNRKWLAWKCSIAGLRWRQHYRKPRVRRVQILGHTVKIIFAVRNTKTTRRNRNTRRNTTSPCAAYKTHGDPRLRRVPTLRHTAKLVPRGLPLTVVGCRTTSWRFVVCQDTAHGEHLSLPCASGKHTAKVQPRVPDPNRCWTTLSLPCADVRHTTNTRLCRVPNTDTRQTQVFAVCRPLSTRQN